MDEFKELNPDVKNLPEDLQKLRYDAAEKFRLETISVAKEQRDKIIENENLMNKKKENMTHYSFYDEEKIEKLKEDQERMVENIKNKQRMEMIQIVEEQYQREFINNQRKEREKKQREKEINNQKEIAEKRLLSIKENKEKAKKREDERIQNEIEIEQKIKEKKKKY